MTDLSQKNNFFLWERTHLHTIIICPRRNGKQGEYIDTTLKRWYQRRLGHIEGSKEACIVGRYDGKTAKREHHRVVDNNNNILY